MMKRIHVLMTALLALLLALGLTACGGDTSTDQQGEPDTPKTVDLAVLRDQIKADCDIQDALDVDAAQLEGLYGITADQVAAAASFTASSGAAFPQEIVMVQAVDETAAAAVQTKLQERLTTIADQAASYDPDSLALAEACTVVKDGVYVGLFFSPDHEAMTSAFEAAVG